MDNTNRLQAVLLTGFIILLCSEWNAVLLQYFWCFCSYFFTGNYTTIANNTHSNTTTVSEKFFIMFSKWDHKLCSFTRSIPVPLFFPSEGIQHCGYCGPSGHSGRLGHRLGGPQLALLRGEKEAADRRDVQTQCRGAVRYEQRGGTRRTEATKGGATHLRCCAFTFTANVCAAALPCDEALPLELKSLSGVREDSAPSLRHPQHDAFTFRFVSTSTAWSVCGSTRGRTWRYLPVDFKTVGHFK